MVVTSKNWGSGISALAPVRAAYQRRLAAAAASAAKELMTPRPDLIKTQKLVAEHATEHKEIIENEKDFLDHNEKPVPIARSVTLHGRMPFQEEATSEKDGVMRASGSVYLGQVISGSAGAIAGQIVFSNPISPLFLGSARLAVMAAIYDLYCFKKLVFEYVPACPTTSAGLLVGWATADVMEDAPLSNSGSAMVSAAMSVPGNEAWTVYTNAAVGVNIPQQAVYFTANADVPNLMVEGEFRIAAVTSLAGALTCGMVFAHYEIEMSQSTAARISQVPISNINGAIATFTGLTLTINQCFFCVLASWGGTPVPFARNAIQCLTIVAVADAGNPVSWRTIRYGEGGVTQQLVPGARVYARLSPSGGNVLFYPSFGSAMEGGDPGASNAYEDVLYNTVTTVIGGAPFITFDDVQTFYLPQN